MYCISILKAKRLDGTVHAAQPAPTCMVWKAAITDKTVCYVALTFRGQSYLLHGRKSVCLFIYYLSV